MQIEREGRTILLEISVDPVSKYHSSIEWMEQTLQTVGQSLVGLLIGIERQNVLGVDGEVEAKRISCIS